MDWNAAIEKNRQALIRVLVMLVAMAGLRGQFDARGQFTFFGLLQPGGASAILPKESKLSPALTLPRHLHRAVLRLLRPAEAAARRLVIVMARGLAMALPPPRRPLTRPALRREADTVRPPPKDRDLRPQRLPLADPLADPLRWPQRRTSPAQGMPRISIAGLGAPVPVAACRPDDMVGATRLALRLAALAAALDDLAGEAKRFARWRARAAHAAGAERSGPRDRSPAAGRVRRLWPLRPGRPPGWKKKPGHEVHEILNVVHGLAFWALEAPDTS